MKYSEDIWNSYLRQFAPPVQSNVTSHKQRYMRINVEWADKRPNFDDIEEIEDIERNATNMMSNEHHSRMAAHKLVASCFYFERTGVIAQNEENGLFKCSGNIICRFDQGGSHMKGLGRILKDHICGSAVSYFILELDYGTSAMRHYDIPIPVDTINEMSLSGTFQMPDPLIISGLHETSLTRLSFCLQPVGFAYSHAPNPSERSVNPSMSISGFPRELFVQNDPLSPLEYVEDEDKDEDEDGDDSEGPWELSGENDILPADDSPKPSLRGLFWRKPVPQSIRSVGMRPEELETGSIRSFKSSFFSKRRSNMDDDGSLPETSDEKSEEFEPGWKLGSRY